MSRSMDAYIYAFLLRRHTRSLTFVMASEVLPLAAHSRYLPMRMKVMIIALVSKKSVGMNWPLMW